MFEIDKEKFGTFVAQLRKEKGLMQKELAQKLYVSDKAVSKWERGLSIPDVTLLVPLADILGVTVTELLECRKIPRAESMDSRQTEQIVQKVIQLSDEEKKPSPGRLVRGLILLVCALISRMEISLLIHWGYDGDDVFFSLTTVRLLMLIFGLYFCIFAREKLPRYYDENKISAFYDGPFRMNLPGLYINNRNLPNIIRAGRIWSLSGLLLCPVVYLLIHLFLPRLAVYSSMILTGLAAVSLIAAMYAAGSKT